MTNTKSQISAAVHSARAARTAVEAARASGDVRGSQLASDAAANYVFRLDRLAGSLSRPSKPLEPSAEDIEAWLYQHRCSPA